MAELLLTRQINTNWLFQDKNYLYRFVHVKLSLECARRHRFSAVWRTENCRNLKIDIGFTGKRNRKQVVIDDP